MRIHLPLHPQHFLPQAAAGPSAPPLVQLGGDLVLVELQGELSWEGDRAGGVVGVLGLDRPDKPTLHLGEHHLLHGKFSNLQKPYAVIRRVVGSPVDVYVSAGAAIEGDAEEEEDAEEDEVGSEEVRVRTPLRPGRAPSDDEDDDADEPPLFPPGSPQTPAGAGRHVHAQAPESSSPFLPPSSIKDYSSELDFSSPAQRFGSKRDRSDDEGEDEDEDEDDNEGEEKEEDEETKRKRLKVERKKAERRAMKPERTRYYEVVGVVRKKVVFALRPEPIVTATVLPE